MGVLSWVTTPTVVIFLEITLVLSVLALGCAATGDEVPLRGVDTVQAVLTEEESFVERNRAGSHAANAPAAQAQPANASKAQKKLKKIEGERERTEKMLTVCSSCCPPRLL